jgi:hypothetical protein
MEYDLMNQTGSAKKNYRISILQKPVNQMSPQGWLGIKSDYTTRLARDKI